MGLGNYFLKRQQKKMLQKLDMGVNHVKHGVYSILRSRFMESEEEIFAGLLAAAVTNTVFGEAPTTEEARTFAEDHKDRISKEVKKVGAEAELVEMINLAIQLKARIVFDVVKSGVDINWAQKPLDNLKKIGLFRKHEKSFPAVKIFFSRAQEFHKRSINLRW